MKLFPETLGKQYKQTIKTRLFIFLFFFFCFLYFFFTKFLNK